MENEWAKLMQLYLSQLPKPEAEEPRPPREIHGCRRVEGRQHHVLDIDFWRGQCPRDEDDRRGPTHINGPIDIAQIELARELVSKSGPLGPSVPVDLFVWAKGRDWDRPWLTHLGGVPWRRKNAPWPTGKSGEALAFLGQICLVDSADVLPVPIKELPGDVVLFFARYENGRGLSIDDTIVVEWSRVELDDPPEKFGSNPPPRGKLPFAFTGVRHRSVQHTNHADYDPVFQRAGFGDEGFRIASVQATSIGTYASLPQGWPFDDERPGKLLCVLSSYYFRGLWPLCDAPTGNLFISHDGQASDRLGIEGLSMGIGDVGCIAVYLDENGRVAHDWWCG